MPKSKYDKKQQRVIDVAGEIAEQTCHLVSAFISQHPEKARQRGKRLMEYIFDMAEALNARS
jgi:hypothetical protein